LVGQFNDKRKNKKLVVLEEVGNTVYEPKHAGKMKDMITNPTQGFNGKHKAIENSHCPFFFMQFTNDRHYLRVDHTGTRRQYHGKHKAIEDSHAVSVSYNLGTLLYSIDLIFLLS
jgi:hypothetical protein